MEAVQSRATPCIWKIETLPQPTLVHLLLLLIQALAISRKPPLFSPRQLPTYGTVAVLTRLQLHSTKQQLSPFQPPWKQLRQSAMRHVELKPDAQASC